MTRRLTAFLLGAALLLLIPLGAAAAATPTPPFGGSTWAQDAALTYRWKAGQVPPASLQSLVHAAAADASLSHGSRAASFSYSSAGMGTIGYGEPTGCGAGGIACATRNPPYSFTVMFRKQGQFLDWGAVRWCHTYTTWPNGCFDAELSGLHEFGHVQILAHASSSNYADTVMGSVQAAYPAYGWNSHAFARCDVATLQLKYDMPTWSAPYSTCLDLVTATAVVASAATVRAGSPVTFWAAVRTGTNPDYLQLGNNPLHDRTAVLQRAAIGGSTWIDVTAMTLSNADGIYFRTVTINASYQWRVSFRPSGEGLRPSTSVAMTVRLE